MATAATVTLEPDTQSMEESVVSTTPINHTSSQAVRVGIVGFSAIEQSIITSVCKLSKIRHKGTTDSHSCFSLVELPDGENVDICLVDIDDPKVMLEQLLAQLRARNVPTILVSKSLPSTDNPNEYPMTRARLGGLLLRVLDQIVNEQLAQDRTRTEAKASKKCLVVDDSQLVRIQMEMILDEHDLTIEFAEDAETALLRIKETRFDIIFLDVMLPKMNGYKACKLIKSDPKTRATPVVMLTSKKSPFNKMHCALVGCDKYLTKPIDASKVHQVLTKYDVIAEITLFHQASLATG